MIIPSFHCSDTIFAFDILLNKVCNTSVLMFSLSLIISVEMLSDPAAFWFFRCFIHSIIWRSCFVLFITFLIPSLVTSDVSMFASTPGCFMLNRSLKFSIQRYTCLSSVCKMFLFISLMCELHNDTLRDNLLVILYKFKCSTEVFIF
jgi:hypothetical protein